MSRPERPVLKAFLAWMAAAPTEIKRELTNTKGMVRIMTVHGSKGLEARIVILVDPGGAPVSAFTIRASCHGCVPDNDLSPPALVWLPPKTDRISWHDEAVETLRKGQEEEYRRLLYVALTRAEDRLIVCGWEPKRGAHDNCWYSLVARLEAQARSCTMPMVMLSGGVGKRTPVRAPAEHRHRKAIARTDGMIPVTTSAA
jgi:ATP-dependent helicase/nuclease subunit A